MAYHTPATANNRRLRDDTPSRSPVPTRFHRPRFHIGSSRVSCPTLAEGMCVGQCDSSTAREMHRCVLPTSQCKILRFLNDCLSHAALFARHPCSRAGADRKHTYYRHGPVAEKWHGMLEYGCGLWCRRRRPWDDFPHARENARCVVLSIEDDHCTTHVHPDANSRRRSQLKRLHWSTLSSRSALSSQPAENCCLSVHPAQAFFRATHELQISTDDLWRGGR